ncbi:molybdenum cofactor cytidylyltransferase [Clostridium saccharobutylicum]|uniref:Putative MobA-like protein n=2 Tax=Clostridium saccharobutylicum TaxID=169679 RepID=U5MTP3_CLOSA|nr:nucleotidyltransferase family protein [Clostridium saccharobutylicum]AGX42827.1 putative MobA-like protein [Clostridium saccharobutylicum DSM 13864]AQR90123.1 purine catabolism protein PucB [Clostridium saccharobutylicum]AQS00029.1 purine catabolism protein PucB [Clostridium saccharobutylicum]AQS14012.1 purine catabolism protein PucB [Clostridium saccharobutylicum]MBA8895846.1 molybdenum cofactor cytidylyltransferase [Clostridium saccharobutylicum]
MYTYRVKAMKINLILLASGNSRRFKDNKLLSIINNKPMFMNVVEEVLKLDFNKIILVTQYEKIKEMLSEKNIEVVMNKNSDLGISHSIVIGIQNDTNADGYMFMVCDQPFIKADTIKRLVNKFISSNKEIVCVEYNGLTGNPAIFSKKYVNDLMNLKGDIGGKCIINRNLHDLETIKVYDKLEIVDIDTKKEFYDLMI